MKMIPPSFLMSVVLTLYLYSPSIMAKETPSAQNVWIYDNVSSVTANHSDIDLMSLIDMASQFVLQVKNDSVYFNQKQFTVTMKTVDTDEFFSANNLNKKNFSLTEMKKYFKLFYGININNKVTYIQFNKSVTNSILSDFLTENYQAIFMNGILFLLKDGYVFPYLTPYFEKEFIKEPPQLPTINVPTNYNVFYNDQPFKKISNHFKMFLTIPWYATDISGARFPSIMPNINPIFIRVGWDSGEADSYLYLFSSNYNVLDNLLVSSYITTTRGGPGGDGYSVGHIYFNIDNNYFIDRWQRFEDETIEINHYQVTEQGRFQEVPVTSNCYSEFAPKNKEIHSPNSILLTAYQANNYLRFNYRQSKISESIDKQIEENRLTITLDPTNQKLCLNYQRSYDVSFNKADSRQFFGDEELYQQQVSHFNSLGIDISEKVDVVSFDKIENTPLALFLMNGNQAIYMNDTLFLVGKDYIVAYKQPTKSELMVDYIEPDTKR